MMYRGFGYGYGGGGLGMLLFGVLVFIAVVLLVVWAVRTASGHHTAGGTVPPSQATGHDEAVAIAKRRLASGEITAEQYGEIIRTLGA
ncbi:MAG TPA: hypothetical protein VIL06_01335 [Coriobacteriia bacterium]